MPARSGSSRNARSNNDAARPAKPDAPTRRGGDAQGSDGAPHWAEGSVVDRRSGIDRRDLQDSGASESGLERRRGPGRRRSDFTRAAEEGEMTDEQFLFIQAIDAFKAANHRAFPTWTDVLEVIRKLGYRKTMSSEVNLRNATDWTEKPDTPSGVDWSKRGAA